MGLNYSCLIIQNLGVMSEVLKLDCVKEIINDFNEHYCTCNSIIAKKNEAQRELNLLKHLHQESILYILT